MPRLINAYDAEENILNALKDLVDIDAKEVASCIRIGLESTEEIKNVALIRRGHWELYVNNGCIDVACSECGHGSEVLGDDQYESLCCFATKYCPECGAYMSTDQMQPPAINNDIND